MELRRWMREYMRIRGELSSLGLNFDRDGEARDVLSGFVRGGRGILRFLKGRPAIVIGNAPARLRLVHPCSVIAADGATKMLMADGIVPDVICTDLDGDMGAIGKAGRRGAVVVVHAHGDNIHKIKRAMQLLRGCKTIGTTQVEPRRGVYNFGGFTDGDRCIFLARKFGATPIGFTGIDFRSKKHAVGRRLIALLKREREDIFNLEREWKGFLEAVYGP